MNIGFLRSMLLSIASSLAMGGWFIESMVASEAYGAPTYYMLMSFFAFMFLIASEAARRRLIRLPKLRYVANGILFTTAAMLFIWISNPTNIVALSAIVTLNMIIFTVINALHHREGLSMSIVARIFVAAILVLMALELIAHVGFAGLTQEDLYLAVAMIFLFGLANYLFSHNSKRAVNEMNFVFWLLLAQLLVSMSVFVALGGGAVHISSGLALYTVSGAALLFISILTMVYSYRHIKDYGGIMRFVGNNVLFMLSETDVVFISALYAIFIDAINPDLILSIVLILASMMAVSTVEEDNGGKKTNIFTHEQSKTWK